MTVGEREITCCFTGHRPEKLPWGSDERDPRCVALKARLREAVEAAYDRGMRRFICGMARGCDFYFAEIVLDLRRRKGDVSLEAAIPCRSQSSSWPPEERQRWRDLVEQCDERTLVQENYTRGCMLRRNRYMVDHSALVIAVYDGCSGGTMRTLEYAVRRQVPFVELSPTGGAENTP